MDPYIAELIQKFFDGQCSSEEKLILNEWYYSFDNEQQPEEVLDENQRMLFEKLMLDRINDNINRIEGAAVTSLHSRKKVFIKSLVYVLPGIAAMLLVVLGINFLKRPVKIPNHHQNVVAEKLTFKNTGKGIQKYTLSDGSTVWLSPDSKIEALKNFEKDKRELFLSGMGFFEVTKNKNRPFIIKTSTITTKVWGTSFTVNAYKDAPIAKVSVLTGKVSVTLSASEKNNISRQIINKEVMLFPNQAVTYSNANGNFYKNTSGINTDLKIWRKINLSFYNTKMDEVIRVLNQKFGVHIVAGDSKINDYSFIADLSEQDLPSILEILKTSLDLNYEINQDKITLRSNN